MRDEGWGVGDIETGGWGLDWISSDQIRLYSIEVRLGKIGLDPTFE